MDQKSSHYMIIREKFNKATLFLLPLIADNHNSTKFTLVDNICRSRNNSPFVNAYISDINKPYLDKHLFIVYDNNASSYNYLYMRRWLRTLRTYHNDYDIILNGKGYTVFAFTIDDKDYDEVKKIIEGLYSKLKEETKKKILAFWDAKYNSRLYSYMHHDSNKEILEQIDIEEEAIKEEDYIPSYFEELLDEMIKDEEDITE